VRLIFAFERYKKMRKEKNIYFVFFAHTKKKCFQQIEKAKMAKMTTQQNQLMK
jgi:hypothetical protein